MELARRLDNGDDISQIQDLPQTVVFSESKPDDDDIILHSYEECLKTKNGSQKILDM